jgi:hypothetical protein
MVPDTASQASVASSAFIFPLKYYLYKHFATFLNFYYLSTSRQEHFLISHLGIHIQLQLKRFSLHLCVSLHFKSIRMMNSFFLHSEHWLGSPLYIANNSRGHCKLHEKRRFFVCYVQPIAANLLSRTLYPALKSLSVLQFFCQMD